MGIGGRRMVEGGFPALERAFLDEARQLRAEGSRLRPFAVLAPNALLRRRLSRALAESGCAYANVHFLTLRNVADRLAGERLAPAGFSPLRGLALAATMAAAAEELEQKLGYFRPAARQEGFQRAMLETLRDLKDAGLRPPDLKRVSALLSAAEADLLKRKLADIEMLWERIEQAKKQQKLYDEADLLEAAAEAAADSPWLGELARLVVYGFYDLTGAQQRLLEACFSRAPATVYFPYRDEAAWRYARPAREWFLSKGFSGGRPDGAGAASEGPPVETLIISAPGEAREALEVVREALFDSPGAPEAPSIGILIRSDAGYTELLYDALKSAQVNPFFQEGPPLSRLPAGRALLGLAILAGGRLRRAEVMDFVTTAPLKPPISSGAGRDEDWTAAWNALTIEAGIVEGRAEWEARLKNKEAELKKDAERKPDCAALAAFRAFLKEFFEGLNKVAVQKTWKGFAAALGDLYRMLVIADDEAETALETLEEVSGLDSTGLPPTLERFRALVREAVEETRPPVGKFERNEPAVVSLMAARGVSFDTVIVPGLVEKSFPQPARQDPILLDAERARLNGLLGRAGIGIQKNRTSRNSEDVDAKAGSGIAVPLKGRRREEEELLFLLAAQSARRRLVLTFPRLDTDKARQRVPSYFLLRVVEATTGQRADYAALEKFLLATPREAGAAKVAARRVPMTFLQAGARDHAVTQLEYDLASFGEAESKQTPNALLYLKHAGGPFFSRARQAESERWGKDEFTKYDGVVTSDDLLRRLGKRLWDDAKPVSPTRLEEYATCPFSYLLHQVFELEPVEEPERAATLSPMHRGSLIHGILWRFLSDAARDKLFPLKETHRPRLEAVAEERFKAFERLGVTGYPLLWKIEKERILKELRTFLENESAEDASFRPAYFEVRFGMGPRDPEESPISTRAPAPFELGGGVTLRFCGKMDRVDVDEAGKRCRVLDYKTGANRRGLDDGSFDGGEALQLPIYLLGARRVLPELQPDYAEYYYASDRGKWRRVRFTGQDLDEKMPSLKFIVRTIRDGIRAGRFFPQPKEADCDRCELRLACGHGRFLDFKRLGGQARADFDKMKDIDG